MLKLKDLMVCIIVKLAKYLCRRLEMTPLVIGVMFSKCTGNLLCLRGLQITALLNVYVIIPLTQILFKNVCQFTCLRLVFSGQSSFLHHP